MNHWHEGPLNSPEPTFISAHWDSVKRLVARLCCDGHHIHPHDETHIAKLAGKETFNGILSEKKHLTKTENVKHKNKYPRAAEPVECKVQLQKYGWLLFLCTY